MGMNPAIPLTAHTPFSSSERFQLAWALAWPCAAIDLLYELVWNFAPMPDFARNLLEPIDLAASLLVITPWVVRRTVALQYSGFRIFAVQPAKESTQILTYFQSLSIGWLLIWRMVAASVGLGLAIVLANWPPSNTPWASHSPFTFAFSTLASFAMFYFWLVSAALNKQYTGFSLRLERV